MIYLEMTKEQRRTLLERIRSNRKTRRAAFRASKTTTPRKPKASTTIDIDSLTPQQLQLLKELL